MPNERMKRILEIADFVKFAKVRPLPDDNVRALTEAVNFVEETKPVEEQPESNQEPQENK
jgi:Pyruvate/2-oxoacid:ferredoxin oxidoreductase gamma subunit